MKIHKIGNIVKKNLLNKFIAPFSNISCLVLHPVTFPNKGPLIQQYLAEQAIGLAKSLNWQIKQGPFWNIDNLAIQANQQQNQPLIMKTLKDGDYVVTDEIRGRFFKGGIIVNPQESSSDGDLYDEWKNKLLRKSLANKCLIKTRRITQKLFFTRGKAQMISQFVKKQKIQCIFINAELTPGQIRNLKKLFESKVNNTRGFKQNFNEQHQSETQFESENQTEKNNQQPKIKVRIFDRFSIILQIFAKRAKTSISKLQIQLNYLNYIKTRLVRSEGSTYSSSYNIFYGDLMKAEEVNLEIVSAKQRRAHAAMSGQGESQLEIQRRSIRQKETKIKKKIQQEKRLRQLNLNKKRTKQKGIPTIALVGYTNAGKSAFMNYMIKKYEVESEDLLFQTLTTTTRQIILPSSTKALLLDTIGFITNLPHQLIESFKSTLEEVQAATLVLHIIDISNPNYEHQRNTVIKVLKELKFPQSFYTQRMIQVWNKIDLLEDKSLLNKENYNISALHGDGVKRLMKQVEQKANLIMNKGKYKFKYGIQHHYQRINWLREHANITNFLQETYDYEPSDIYPNGYVEYEVILDNATYGKFEKMINQSNNIFKKSKKGMPPKDWSKKKNM